MKENKSDCQEHSHQVRYHPYSKLPSKQVLEELTNDFPDIDLSKNPIKGKMGEILQILFAMVIQETLNCECYLPTASSDGGATHQSTTTHLNIPNNTPQPNQFANHDGVKEEEQEEISCGETPSLEIYTPATSEPLTTWEQSNAVPSTSCALSTETIKSPSSQTVKEEPESE